MEFMAASILPPAYPKKKSKGERKKETIFTTCLYSRSACFREGGCDVYICIVCERILSGNAAGKIMDDQRTAFSGKLSSDETTRTACNIQGVDMPWIYIVAL
ncbi:unnamed protein product [Natator depressus]